MEKFSYLTQKCIINDIDIKFTLLCVKIWNIENNTIHLQNKIKNII